MPKDEIDDLIAAIEAVEFLKDAVAKHDRSIAAIMQELDRLKASMAAAAPKP